jgi:hypothetical protein
MRSIKYLPLVSTSNSFKYLRNLINFSLQKLNSIDINLVIDKYIKSEEKDKTNNSLLKSSVENLDNKKLIGSQNNNNNNKQIIENQLFESVINEWIESPVNNKSNNVSKNVLTKDKNAISLPLMTKSSLEMRTKQLIRSLSTIQSSMSTVLRLQELNKHLRSFPESTPIAVKENAIQKVLRLRHLSHNEVIESHSMQVLSLLGHCDPPKGTGIKILSIDGGGIATNFYILYISYFNSIPNH